MNKKFGTKWINELRTTTKKQGTDRFYNKEYDTYCSMGIGLHANKIDPEAAQYFPDYIMEKYYSLDLFWEMVSLNDRKGNTFIEIADWIEENVEFY